MLFNGSEFEIPLDMVHVESDNFQLTCTKEKSAMSMGSFFM